MLERATTEADRAGGAEGPRTPQGEHAAVDGRAAGGGVVAREGERAVSPLLERASATDRTDIARRVSTIEDERAVVEDIPSERAGCARVIADLHRAGRDRQGGIGPGDEVVPGDRARSEARQPRLALHLAPPLHRGDLGAGEGRVPDLAVGHAAGVERVTRPVRFPDEVVRPRYHDRHRLAGGRADGDAILVDRHRAGGCHRHREMLPDIVLDDVGDDHVRGQTLGLVINDKREIIRSTASAENNVPDTCPSPEIEEAGPTAV